jgi:hypothetical protein
MFAQFAGGFREFGDFENLATKTAFATGFSGDCKHELLASVTRFDNLNFVIAKALVQEESPEELQSPRISHEPPVIRLGDFPQGDACLQEQDCYSSRIKRSLASICWPGVTRISAIFPSRGA